MMSDLIQRPAMSFVLVVLRTHKQPAMGAIEDLAASAQMVDSQNTATVDTMSQRTFVVAAPADPMPALCPTVMRSMDNGRLMGMCLSVAECQVLILTMT